MQYLNSHVQHYQCFKCSLLHCLQKLDFFRAICQNNMPIFIVTYLKYVFKVYTPGQRTFRIKSLTLSLTLTLLRGWWGRCEKNYLPKEKGREGGEKNACSVPGGPGARTRDLPRAGRGSPAARQGGCLDKQAFQCL